MSGEPIHDRGPEIVGTRITVYNLLPYFLDATATETFLCRLYDLTPEQVAAARAYVLNHADAVLARHMDIEARLAEGNPPEVRERAQETRAAFLRFKDWVVKRRQADGQERAENSAASNGTRNPEPLPTFREWLAQQES